MHAQPTPAPTSHPAEPPAEDAQHHRRVLNELIDMGLDLARAVHAQAKLPANAEPTEPASATAPTQAVTLTIAFDRIARAIRRTINLARHLDHPIPPPAAQLRATTRRRILRDVEDAIQRREPEPGDGDRLHAELHERLDGPDLDDDIGHRPTADIIADICRDLGIAGPPGPLPWKRRTPADIAALCARAARPPAAQMGNRRISPVPRAPAPTDHDPAPHRADEPERVFRIIASPNDG